LNPVRGITLKILSVLIFVTMIGMIKATSQHIPPGEAVFFRSVFAIPVLIIWLMLRGDFPAKLKAKDPMGHVWRGLMGTCAMACGFLAIGLLPLPEVVAIGYAAPLLVTMLAAMFLGEKIRLVRFSALLLGLFGVLLVLSPRLTILDAEVTSRLQTIGALAALMGAMFSALAQVFARKLVATETTGSIVFYFSIMSTVLSLLTLPFGWAVPDTREATLLVTAGLLGGVGQILLTESYRYAEVAVIAPFEYCSILIALLVGYFIFDELPTGIMMAGVALIITAGIIIIERERRLGIRRTGKARSVVPNQG
jgi:drug/metabolite transporter (DMT)-like permease